jgi:glucose dehydrogenase
MKNFSLILALSLFSFLFASLGRAALQQGETSSDPPARASDAFLAFDMATGKLAWSRQMTEGEAFNVDCSAAPEQRKTARRRKDPILISVHRRSWWSWQRASAH